MAETESGGVQLHQRALPDDEALDGNYVLLTNDPATPAEELVRGYRDLWRADQAFRDMKTTPEIEPAYHRADQRITAHAHLCVLAYLLLRLGRTGRRWLEARPGRLQRVTLTRIETPEAALHNTKRLGPEKWAVWNCCRVQPPPKALRLS